MIVVAALLIGIVAGLRALTPAAVVSWGAYLGWMSLKGTSLAFLGFAAAAYILAVLAVVELITDQLPKTPSRKSPPGFGARLVTGALCGAAIGAAHGSLVVGLIAGVVGAVIGTLGGYEARVRLARAFGRDTQAALIEDVVAIGGAVLIVGAMA
jgi:uncharacterized membrane protein